MKKRTKWIGGSVGAIGVLALAVFATGSERIDIEVESVTRGPLTVSVQGQGQTRPRERYTVAAPTSGRVTRTDVEEGDPVDVGAVLARLAPTPEDARARATARAALEAAEARQRQAQAALTEARDAHEQALREVERRRSVHELGGLSRETVERFERQAAAAQARLSEAEAGLQAANADVQAARARSLGSDFGGAGSAGIGILSPVAGRVLRIFEESERVVIAGTPLFQIAPLSGLEIVVDVLTEEAVAVAPGATVWVRDWGGGDTLLARVRTVEPAAFTKVSTLGVEEQRVNVIADLEAAPASLGAGYRVQAEIVTWQSDDALSAPTNAIFRRGAEWQAFVVDGGRARLQSVQIGRRGRDRAQVLGGLEEGDEVILFPSDLVQDGVRVRPEAER